MTFLKRLVICLLLGCLLLTLAACGGSTNSSGPSGDTQTVQEKPFTYIGLYIWDNAKDYFDFFKACGVNTLQLAERIWWFNSDTALERAQGLSRAIDGIHEKGMYVDLLFFSNLRQYHGPDDYDKDSGGIGVWFDPQDEQALADKMFYVRQTMEQCANADFFTVEAGDPGGMSAEMRAGTAEDFAAIVRAYAAAAAEVAPNVKVHANTWALSAYGEHYPVSLDYRWWQQETEMTKAFTQIAGLIGSSVGICLPCHDYYRDLCRNLWYHAKIWGEVEETPVAYPQVEDIAQLRRQGVNDLWLWPFNLLETDGSADYCATFTCNLRYVQQFLQDVRPFGADGIMADWTWKACCGMAMNFYGYARMAADPSATPAQVMREYAGFLAAPESVDTLTEIFTFIENHSAGDQKRLSRYVPDPLPCTLASAEQALAALDTVVPLTGSSFPLPEPIPDTFERIRARLEALYQEGA
ncbi:MAG: hypothetical protein IKI50_06470 [Clostridia bacterium]|nr:hypothetical protein [Clostridia bacterium]